VPCNQISAEWGEQRIKGLSVVKTISHFVKSQFQKKTGDVAQKNVETSLIERFLYPKYGPGQMWEEVARRVEAQGGKILTKWEVRDIEVEGDRVTAAIAVHTETGERRRFAGDYFISTLPVKELIRSLQTPIPSEVQRVSDGLLYRDFVTVGLLLNKLKVIDKDNPGEKLITDNWIYIQEPGVKAGRLQIFNNWSPYLVQDPDKVWVGVEYFCYEGDELWNLSEKAMAKLAADELDEIGIIDKADVVDEYVFKMPKTYPAYFGTYDEFPKVREFVDEFKNLFLVGRNGMHKYNNQDHSMLTAMMAVENIAAGRQDKENLWAVNTEMEYHEEKENVTERAPQDLEQTAA
jgi:protoporphyrinogen oxidase